MNRDCHNDVNTKTHTEFTGILTPPELQLRMPPLTALIRVPAVR